ncbi:MULTISPECIES: DEAD/DEAH box helicase [Bacillota]|uniref:DEAD/DEAH box helicase n=1 Tax=Bacillota TaxID=1239 RepID=UPI000E42244E|nr:MULTISPECIES: DEAD/DEAH box helicase [Bacillota]RGB55098.1 ATP-dependent helicase [Absiella sp. AM22-9]
MTLFNELNISSEVMKAVEEMGYENATDIQAQSIPMIIEGKDVLGRSNTGTGKTAAFGIPAIEMVEAGSKYPNAMIICPTRELVTQVATELRKFSKYKEGVKIVPIYGGQPIDSQIKLLKRGCGIVVGTPGRIMDHLRRKTLRLNDTRMVILDEADEMLNMGFKEDIEEILSSMPAENEHQTILFSATWPADILKITEQFQKNPVRVEIKSSQRTIDTVEQLYYDVPRGKKANALRVLLNHYDPDLCMIFCNTKKMVDDLCTELNKHDIKALSLHGDMKQEFRTRVMDQFRNGGASILIATDVAARGIDVDDIDLVVNFDLPQDNEYYIHRVGRTGRAGKKGLAITLVSGGKQRGGIKDIIRYTKTNITRHALPTSAQMIEANRTAFIQTVKEACDEGITEESMEIANELIAEGIALENIISALISMTYKNEIIDIEADEDVKRYASDFDAITLKFSIGRNAGVKPGNIVAAIIEECSISGKAIGRIDVRKDFTLVDVEADKVDTVLNNMQRSHIRGEEVMVEIDSAPKRKNRKDGGRRDGGRDRDGGNRSRSKGGDRRDRGNDRKGSSKDGGRSNRGGGRRNSTNHDKSVRKSGKKVK